MASHRVAVLLAGSGVYDGSEVHEASAALVALSRHNAQILKEASGHMLKSQEQSKNSDASMLRRLFPKLASTKRTRSLRPLLLCMKVVFTKFTMESARWSMIF
ncbi:unnamed protein product [Oikopleura dioica]|uniref:Uncharacterized protein n=1 Tax=Oikopleura dioica TaxID=34765 RepID=E4XRP3_OIKDI|nr:unnamed protein product [Oikopleura dioica]